METTHESSNQTLCSAQPAKPYAFSRKVFCEGMRDGVPIALGYFAVSFSLGIAARTAGFTPLQGFVASLLNNASAGEYAAFALIASGATYLEVAIITLIANARYLLMSCALAQRFAPGTPFFHRLIIGYDVTDELFGITIARPGYLNPFYTYGAIALAAPAWASGTALGIIAGNLLPLRAVSALSVALYGMFIAIVVPPAKKNRDIFVAVVLALIFGGIMATAVFSYLMQTRSVGAMHALPQRRGTLFWTHFLTGWAMLAAGNLLVLAVTALTALLGGLALTPALLTWFVVATLLDLIFLALGTLCAMVTGWLLAVPVLYAAVNCLAVALTWLGQQLAELLLDGFTMPDVQPVITRWLTPVYQLICDLGQSGPKYSPFLTGKLPENYIQNADCASGLTPQGWRTLLIFTAVALVLTVLSRLLYGRRKSELSGDAAAFSWMRPVFRLGVGLVGGLPLGMLLYVLVSVGRSGDFSPARLCVCMAVMGIVCYLAAAMLVGKTLRVLPKRLPGAAVTALVLVLLCVVLMQTAGMVVGPGRTHAQGEFGAMLLREDAGGYVLVGVSCFAAATAITALCFRLRRREKREDGGTAGSDPRKQEVEIK
mgnify:CR=1 FL=1